MIIAESNFYETLALILPYLSYVGDKHAFTTLF